MNSCEWIGMPSVAVKITCCGVTSPAGSKPAGSMFSSRLCALPSGQMTITCGGICGSACIAATLPSLVTTGCHSLPIDFTALRVGFAEPSTGTDQTWR